MQMIKIDDYDDGIMKMMESANDDGAVDVKRSLDLSHSKLSLFPDVYKIVSQREILDDGDVPQQHEVHRVGATPVEGSSGDGKRFGCC